MPEYAGLFGLTFITRVFITSMGEVTIATATPAIIADTKWTNFPSTKYPLSISECFV